MTYIKSHKTCQEHVEVMLLCDFHIHHHDNTINIYCMLYSLIYIMLYLTFLKLIIKLIKQFYVFCLRKTLSHL